jgi:hypothetical protein
MHCCFADESNKLPRVLEQFQLTFSAMTDAPRSVALCLVLILCFASVALADDFKTIDGKEYKNATVKRVEPDGIVLTNSSGISKVYFVELPKEVQQHFHYDAARAAQFTAATQTAISQSNAAIAAEQQAAAAEQNRKKELWHREQAAAQQQQAEIQRQEEAKQLSAGRAEAANALANAKRRVNSVLGGSHPQQSNAAGVAQQKQSEQERGQRESGRQSEQMQRESEQWRRDNEREWQRMTHNQVGLTEYLANRLRFHAFSCARVRNRLIYES